MAKKKENLPWIKFFPADWLKDTRHLSLAARGAWIDLICFMWNAPERGKLVDTFDGFARRIGTDVATATAIINEIANAENPVCDRENLARKNIRILCRRIVREEGVRAQAQKNGALGGNPELIWGVIPPDKDIDKSPPNPSLTSGIWPLASSENGKVRKGKNGFPPFPPELSSADFRAAWLEFFRYRKEIGVPIKPVTAKNLFLRMKLWGVQKSIEEIRVAISNGWKGPSDTSRRNGAGSVEQSRDKQLRELENLP